MGDVITAMRTPETACSLCVNAAVRLACKEEPGATIGAESGWIAVVARILNSATAEMAGIETMTEIETEIGIGIGVLFKLFTVNPATENAIGAVKELAGKSDWFDNAAIRLAFKAAPGDATAAASGWIADAARILKSADNRRFRQLRVTGCLNSLSHELYFSLPACLSCTT